MRIIKSLFIVLMTLPVAANAKVFECKSPKTGEMLYQATPCPPSDFPIGELKIKEMSPEEKAAAEAKLKAEEQEEASFESSEAKAKKQQQAELQRKEELELQERRTRAAEEQADTERKRILGGPGSPYWRPTDQDN